MDTYNLLIALIVLTCLLIIMFIVYLLNHHVRRERNVENQHHVDLEASIPTYDPSRPKVSQELRNDEQRLSHLTTVAPSIELLPEIRTRSERAEDWLDRRDSWTIDGDLGLETYKMSNVKNEGRLERKRKSGNGDYGYEENNELTMQREDRDDEHVSRQK
jgi:hypothetical protein